MTDETTVTPDVTTEDAPVNNVNISIEQITAAILTTINSVEVPLENLLANYGNKVIAINQDETTKAVTFSLEDAPQPQDVQAEITENTEAAE